MPYDDPNLMMEALKNRRGKTAQSMIELNPDWLMLDQAKPTVADAEQEAHTITDENGKDGEESPSGTEAPIGLSPASQEISIEDMLADSAMGNSPLRTKASQIPGKPSGPLGLK